ncbi:MAG: hypothetical protein DRQ06_00800 [Candidatus Hydrothermota bacterium]|nr:MAG: hypothetical protein DRQ06_00800 [Candidatus Hydrothermae bacterium]RKZ01418.1 MAG: hypothetical protein DRQ04_04915 [Candidatus Hydrothermae bacterium]
MRYFVLFLFLISLLLGAYLLFFYEFRYRPLKIAFEDLKRENEKLVEILTEREKAWREEKLQSMEPVLPAQIEKPLKEEPAGGLSVSFSEKDLFKPGSWRLSDKGKRILSDYYATLRRIKFREIEILIHTDPPGRRKLAAKRALEVKKLFVKKGLDRNKVWAWVRRDVEPGKVLIKIKR